MRRPHPALPVRLVRFHRGVDLLHEGSICLGFHKCGALLSTLLLHRREAPFAALMFRSNHRKLAIEKVPLRVQPVGGAAEQRRRQGRERENGPSFQPIGVWLNALYRKGTAVGRALLAELSGAR